MTGLIGPNGAGKTTLFNVISGLQAPDRGTVHLFDTDITTMKPHRRARLGLARTFQRLELFGTLSAGENVQVGLESSVKWWQWRHVKRAVPVGEAGRRGADDGRASEPTGPGSVAAGHLRPAARRASAWAGWAPSRPRHAHRPGPDGGAGPGPGHRPEAPAPRRARLGPRRGRVAGPRRAADHAWPPAAWRVLLVEHDMELVMRICDHIYVLDFGDIIASGTPEEIRRDPMVQAAYLGEAQSDAEADAAASSRPGTGCR